MDIVVDGRSFLAFIEIKIGAPEGDQQISRYLELAKEKAGDRKYCLILISPERRLLSEDVNFLAATWSDLATAVEVNVETRDSFSGRLLSQFAHHIRKF